MASKSKIKNNGMLKLSINLFIPAQDDKFVEDSLIENNIFLEWKLFIKYKKVKMCSLSRKKC